MSDERRQYAKGGIVKRPTGPAIIPRGCVYFIPPMRLAEARRMLDAINRGEVKP